MPPNSKYYQLEGVLVNKRPVYTSRGENQTLSNDTDIILFTGAHWTLSSASVFPELELYNLVYYSYYDPQWQWFTNYRLIR